ncbi:MAG: ParA family protein [Treponema sp.]|nr:ParA family protein [Treponema sp.]
MKTVCFSLQKGGVGKSSLSMALAGELAVTYGPTVLIDGDPQGNITGQLYPIIENKELADLLFDIAEGKAPNLKEAVHKTSFPNLSIIQTAGLDGRLRLYSETLANSNPWAMDELIKELVSWGFKYCVIDTSPAFGPLEQSILLSVDECLTPLMGDVYGQDGLQIFAENLKQLRKRQRSEKPHYNRIIFNAYDKRISSHDRILDALKLNAEGMQLYCFPTDPVYRRAQDASTVIQALSGAKEATRAELSRLAKSIY